MKNLRNLLQEMAEEDKEQMKATLRHLAFEAEYERRATCPKCNHKFGVSYPNAAAQTNALRLWFEMGYGRAPSGAPVTDIPTQVTDLELLSDDQLAAIASGTSPS